MAANQPDSDEDDTIPYDMHTFREWANSIQRQIDRTNWRINDCAARISELEPDDTASSTQLPDSNGFWRDNEGDIWAYGGNDNNPPTLLFFAESHRVTDICENPAASWSDIEFHAPFTKIDNPFTTGNDNADL